MDHSSNMNSSTSARWPSDAMPETWIEKLFEIMELTYGSKFLDMWGNTDKPKQKLFWAQKLGTVTAEQMKRDVAKLERLAWPPTLSEFKLLCQPEIKPLEAYYEAVEGCRSREQGEAGTWSHPAIFWASVRVSSFDLKSLSYSQVKDRWNTALESELAKTEWPAIPMPVLALPAPGNGRADREAASKRLSELKAGNVVKQEKQVFDHRSWARKILKRKAAGDKTLSFIQVKFAQDALNKGD